MQTIYSVLYCLFIFIISTSLTWADFHAAEESKRMGYHDQISLQKKLYILERKNPDRIRQEYELNMNRLLCHIDNWQTAAKLGTEEIQKLQQEKNLFAQKFLKRRAKLLQLKEKQKASPLNADSNEIEIPKLPSLHFGIDFNAPHTRENVTVNKNGNSGQSIHFDKLLGQDFLMTISGTTPKAHWPEEKLSGYQRYAINESIICELNEEIQAIKSATKEIRTEIKQLTRQKNTNG